MDKIGKYQILETIGKGAMGEVFKARDEVIDRIVAIKVIHPHFVGEEIWEDLQARFQQEAKAAARCLHPNIVAVFDFGQFEDTSYLVMEYIKGDDLKDILDANGRFSLQEAIGIIGEVLNGLAFAHENGVIHRDIKPANIIKLSNGQIKIADFGIARLDSSELTNVGDMVGTPIYMSPEALRGDTVDARSDLYAVALALLELITGSKPTAGFVDIESIQEQLDDSSVEKQYHQYFIDVFAKALHRKPDFRFQSATAFLNKLKEFLAETHVSTRNAEHSEDDFRTMIQSSPLLKPRENVIGEESLPDKNLLDKLEHSLASYIGPLSSVLVRRATATSITTKQIISELSQHITNDDDRSEFIRKINIESGISSGIENRLQESSSSHSMGSKRGQTFILEPERLAYITEKLAIYLGPMAPIIIKKTIKKVDSEKMLIEALSEKIAQRDEKTLFLHSFK
jgi:serine/threonine-protein kinase